MLRLIGADVDLTSTDHLVVRWCGYTHLVKLSEADAGVFRALERARLEVEAEVSAKSAGAIRGHETRKAKAKAAGLSMTAGV